MKKLFAMVLALCMVCGAAALGEETKTVITPTSGQEAQTTVALEIKAKTDFTVTIPAVLNVDSETGRGSVDLAIDARKFKEEGWGVKVSLDAASGMAAKEHPGENDFSMRDGNGNTIPYKLTDERDGAFSLGDQILGWTCEPGGSSGMKITMTLIAQTPNNPAIGTYTDTLTFLVSLVGPANQ